MRAVLFDLDDTLVDQRTASSAAVTAWAAELGITGDGVESRWAVVSERHFARHQRREITFAGQRRERVRDFLGATLSDAEADGLFAGYLERYEAGWIAFDDAGPALRRVRAAGLTVAVLTNGDDGQQRRKLERVGLTAEVDLLVASSMLPVGKPDPRAFRHAVDLLGADPGEVLVDLLGADPGEVLMVGDSLAKDVRGAVAAGLPAVLLDRAGDHPEAGVPTIRSLDDVDEHLER